MAAIDLLLVIAAVLIIAWLVGVVAFSLGPLLYVLLVVALIIVIVRLAKPRAGEQGR